MGFAPAGGIRVANANSYRYIHVYSNGDSYSDGYTQANAYCQAECNAEATSHSSAAPGRAGRLLESRREGSCDAALGIVDHLRRRSATADSSSGEFARLKSATGRTRRGELCADFLEARGKSVNLLLLVRGHPLQFGL